uniref:(northern house mosquito) hypothetical protein n=1 Tax=Culex pipiens TaxID=7175 RepID=A0A8D8KFY5_CULPI
MYFRPKLKRSSYVYGTSALSGSGRKRTYGIPSRGLPAAIVQYVCIAFGNRAHHCSMSRPRFWAFASTFRIARWATVCGSGRSWSANAAREPKFCAIARATWRCIFFLLLLRPPMRISTFWTLLSA